MVASFSGTTGSPLRSEIDHVGLAGPILAPEQEDLTFRQHRVDVHRADSCLAAIEMRGRWHVANDEGGAALVRAVGLRSVNQKDVVER